MSKSPKSTAAEAHVEPTQVTTAPTQKNYPLPLDGTKGQEFISANGGVSKSIRVLTEKGFTRGEVSRMLGKRYQHVRNVLITPVKKTA